MRVLSYYQFQFEKEVIERFCFVLFLVEKSLGNNNCLIDCLIACLCVRRVKKTSKKDFRQNTSYEVFQCWEHDSEVSSVADQLGGGGGRPLGVKKTSETDFRQNTPYEVFQCWEHDSEVSSVADQLGGGGDLLGSKKRRKLIFPETRFTRFYDAGRAHLGFV